MVTTNWRELRESLYPEGAFSTFNTISHRGVAEVIREESVSSPLVNSADMVKSSENAIRHSGDPTAESVNSAKSSEDSNFQQCARRLEAAGISIAVLDDGTMRVISSPSEANQAALDGFTVYSPREMLLYVILSQRERRLLHSLKRLRQND